MIDNAIKLFALAALVAFLSGFFGRSGPTYHTFQYQCPETSAGEGMTGRIDTGMTTSGNTRVLSVHVTRSTIYEERIIGPHTVPAGPGRAIGGVEWKTEYPYGILFSDGSIFFSCYNRGGRTLSGGRVPPHTYEVGIWAEEN